MIDMKKYSNVNVVKGGDATLLKVILTPLRASKFDDIGLANNIYHLEVPNLIYPYTLVYVLGRYKKNKQYETKR